MKQAVVFLLIFTLFSCNMISKDVESSFLAMSIKLDSLNKLEFRKIKDHFLEINSRQIEKWQEENSALVYSSTLESNQKMDSLLSHLQTSTVSNDERNEIISSFRSYRNETLYKIRTVADSINKVDIDSLINKSRDFTDFPEYSVIAELKSQQLEMTELGARLMEKINVASSKADVKQ